MIRTTAILAIFVYLSFSFHTTVWLKDEYPQDYFAVPVKHKISISGTFGELRTNHFHAGIDFRPSVQGREGDPIVSSADGYVSRVRIAPGGYGHALYIDHPNGYTTVYAHVENFYTELEQWIRAQQYELKQFDVDLYPEREKFRVKKGQQVATMGNRGSSSAAHLHYEIRHSATQIPINPLLFGIRAPDRRAPELRALRIFHLNPDNEEIRAETKSITQQGGKYVIQPETIRVGAWRVGLGLSAIDRLDGAANQNGIYSLNMWVDDELIYNFTMDEIGFDETRYLNAHLDYAEQVSNRRFFHKAYRMPGNFAGIYNLCIDDGVIQLFENKPRKVVIEAGDFAGNTSRVQFNLLRAAVPETTAKVYNYTWPIEEGVEIRTRDLKLSFEPFSFYEQPYININVPAKAGLNSVFEIGDFRTPVHAYYSISLRPEGVIPYQMDKLVILHRRTTGGRVVSLGGEFDGNYVSAQTRELGLFSLVADTTPPTIQAISFLQDMRTRSRMSWKITDNYRTGPGVPNFKHYEARINDKWVLLQYDSKKDLFFHDFEFSATGKTHTVYVEAVDVAGNKATFKREFVR